MITKIADFDFNLKLFKLNLSVILMPASISPPLLYPFNGRLNITTLINSPQFEIIEKPPIIESNVQKKNMTKIGSDIEEGHILCFLSGIGICTKLKNSVISKFISDIFKLLFFKCSSSQI